MRSPEEVRRVLQNLLSIANAHFSPASENQAQGFITAIGALEWVLGDDTESSRALQRNFDYVEEMLKSIKDGGKLNGS